MKVQAIDEISSVTRSNSVSMPSQPDRKLFGVLQRKQRWGLSVRGWVALLLLVVTGAVGFVTGIYPFLAETHRVETNVLVVEGWVQDAGIRATIEEFKTGRYSRVFTTGGRLTGSGGGLDSPLAADVIADWLNYRGIPKEVLQPVPSHTVGRDRTYCSAADLRNWFRERRADVRSLNVVTETVHARRTRLLYEKAFGDDVAVGIIAAPNPDYNPRQWWNSSDGFRDVISETIAYVYARVFFSAINTDAGPRQHNDRN